jgi:hypothetical protein
MLIRLDNPRLVLNAQEFPENMALYCISYAECAGDVVVNFVNPSTSRLITQPIQPTRALSIFDGFTLHEYVLPFYDLVDPIGRRGATHGFTVIGRSSYRVSGANYQVRTLEFVMIFPVIGGGVIRMRAGDHEWDIANPTFNPQARIPEVSRSYGIGSGDEYVSGPSGIENQRVPDEVLINAYQRTHQGYIGAQGSEVERRRQDRLANFDLRESIAQPPIEQPVMTPARQGRTNVLTGRPREIDPEPRIIGIDLGLPRSSGIIAPIASKPKAPPRTRFERIQENCEEANEPKK